MFFWNSLAFSMIQQMLAIWSLDPLPFLKPAWTSGSSWFMYCWSLAWRILSIILLALTIWTFVVKVMSLLFNTWSRVCYRFPSKEQVSFNFMTTVAICSDFGAQENKVWHVNSWLILACPLQVSSMLLQLDRSFQARSHRNLKWAAFSE